MRVSLILTAFALCGCGEGILSKLGGASVEVTYKYYLYSASNSDGKVAGFKINASTGVLEALPGSPYAGGSAAAMVVATPDGKFLYAASVAGVAAYKIEPGTGVLSKNPSGPFPAGTSSQTVAVHPSGRFLYAGNHDSANITGFLIDTATGSLSVLPGSPYAAGASPNLMTIDSLGRFLYVANGAGPSVSAYTIDSATGALSPNGGPYTVGVTPKGIVIEPKDGNLYVMNTDGGSVSSFSLAAATGSLNELAGSPLTALPDIFEARFEPTGRALFVAATTPGKVYVLLRDPGSGSVSLGATHQFGDCTLPLGLAVFPRGGFLFVACAANHKVAAYAIDSELNGNLSAVAGAPFASGISFPVSVAIAAVPD